MTVNVEVYVRGGDVARAMRRWRKACESSGVFRDIKRLEAYTPPSQRRRVEHRRALKRARKAL
jgi:ribosomal protein S21